MDAFWDRVIREESAKPYWAKLMNFLRSEEQAGRVIYPAAADWFRALELTPMDQTRVVVLGQDPYHGEGQAHGLAFSVRRGVVVPRSLQNIYRELRDDIGVNTPRHGNLEAWARQGVLLLNAVLTVEAGRANVHEGRGWEVFTDRVVRELNDRCEGLVFVLWGAYAQKKGAIVDRSRHLVIESAHPSPLSARRGFFGSRPFSRINEYLIGRGVAPIDWRLDE